MNFNNDHLILQTFQNKESFDDEAIVHTRKQWASFLLECMKHHKIDD